MTSNTSSKAELLDLVDRAFNTLWYDSFIPDAATRPLQQAVTACAPRFDDDAVTLQAKAIMIRAFAKKVFVEDPAEQPLLIITALVKQAFANDR